PGEHIDSAARLDGRHAVSAVKPQLRANTFEDDGAAGRGVICNDRGHHAGGGVELLDVRGSPSRYEIHNPLPGFVCRALRDRADVAAHPHRASSVFILMACLKADSICATVSFPGSLAVSMSDAIATKISFLIRRPSRPSDA